MIGLRGTRVFILDDDESEALPIIKALTRQGIPVAFFDGTMTGLPPTGNKLIGVRLAILDMDLGEGGNSEKTMASAVVKRIERIIHVDNGPYVALIWTNRPDVKDEFENYIFKSSVPNPVVTVMITKAEVKNKKGTKFLISRIAKRVDDELKNVGPLQILEAWEQANFTAAAGVTSALSSLTTPGMADLSKWRTDWKQQLLQLLRAMADAKAEKHLDVASCIPSIYGALNPLHFDQLGKEISATAKYSAKHAPEIMAAIADPGAERKAQINSMMHLDFYIPPGLNPGNLYFFDGVKRPAWVPQAKDILGGFLQQNADELLNNSTPLLAEISAVCDHAQKKIQMARLLGGVAFPTNLRKHLNIKAVEREGSALWRIGPLDLTGSGLPPGQYDLYFNARYVNSLTLKQVRKLKAKGGFRYEAFAHLQTWFAFQSSRPGMTLLKGA